MQPTQHPTPDLNAHGVPIAVVSPESQQNERSVHDRLVRSRLGVYTGLFYALRAKHPPTAAHALRVAIGCSKWADWRQLSEEERSLLEVAALLHDVGKIGVPDRILQKPDQLSGQELLMMEMQHGLAREMLLGAGASEELANIVRLARRDNASDAPQTARMLAIVDAFDSMTTEQVFRRAMSRDRAIEELFAHTGTQFDADLVQDFAELISQPRPKLEASLVQRWLSALAPNLTPGFWESDLPASSGAVQNMVDTLFHHRLLDTLMDAAIYVDSEGQILHWNRAAEQLTGHQAASLMHRQWTPEIMGLHSEEGTPISGKQCPLQRLMATHTQVNERLRLQHVDDREFIVLFKALPVFSGKHELSGAILLVRDASTQVSLEQKVQSLHEIAHQDTLTKVANRAQLNRQLPKFLAEHLEDGRRGSLIICDIDYFKRINDTFGHQTGDEALVTFAGLLKEVARDEDFIARYGGEEFVVLCDGCDNSAATGRAEQMRRKVENTPIPALEGKSLTSSFGVTEIQPGDSSETLLARADRALLMAKESGRNRVVQLGSGQDTSCTTPTNTPAPRKRSVWMGWFRSAGESILSSEYLAAVPKEVAIQKLEGFINDHRAELVSVEESRIAIRVDGNKNIAIRRSGERPAVMLLDVSIQNVEVCVDGRQKTYLSRTKFTVSIRPVRARDRRSDVLRGQASQLLQSFQAYLVAQEVDDELRQCIIEPR